MIFGEQLSLPKVGFVDQVTGLKHDQLKDFATERSHYATKNINSAWAGK